MDVVFLIDNWLFPILITIYGLAAYRLLKPLGETTNEWEQMLFQWLRKFLGVFAVIIILQVVFLSINLWILEKKDWIEYLHFNLLLIMMLWLCIKTWQQYFPHHIFEHQQERQTLSQEHLRFKEKTEELFEKKLIFLNPDLDLYILSTYYGLSKRKLSAMIREVYNKNVTEFINGYRTVHVLKGIATNKHVDYSLLGLAFEAGFSSKSTFYRAFKLVTGNTPSTFIKKSNS